MMFQESSINDTQNKKLLYPTEKPKKREKNYSSGQLVVWGRLVDTVMYVAAQTAQCDIYMCLYN
jgi:hypothetical protein